MSLRRARSNPDGPIASMVDMMFGAVGVGTVFFLSFAVVRLAALEPAPVKEQWFSISTADPDSGLLGIAFSDSTQIVFGDERLFPGVTVAQIGSISGDTPQLTTSARPMWLIKVSEPSAYVKLVVFLTERDGKTDGRTEEPSVKVTVKPFMGNTTETTLNLSHENGFVTQITLADLVDMSSTGQPIATASGMPQPFQSTLRRLGSAMIGYDEGSADTSETPSGGIQPPVQALFPDVDSFKDVLLIPRLVSKRYQPTVLGDRWDLEVSRNATESSLLFRSVDHAANTDPAYVFEKGHFLGQMSILLFQRYVDDYKKSDSTRPAPMHLWHVVGEQDEKRLYAKDTWCLLLLHNGELRSGRSPLLDNTSLLIRCSNPTFLLNSPNPMPDTDNPAVKVIPIAIEPGLRVSIQNADQDATAKNGSVRKWLKKIPNDAAWAALGSRGLMYQQGAEIYICEPIDSAVKVISFTVCYKDVPWGPVNWTVADDAHLVNQEPAFSTTHCASAFNNPAVLLAALLRVSSADTLNNLELRQHPDLWWKFSDPR